MERLSKKVVPRANPNLSARRTALGQSPVHKMQNEGQQPTQATLPPYHFGPSSQLEDTENFSPGYSKRNYTSSSDLSSITTKARPDVWQSLTKEYESKAAPPDEATRENVNKLVYHLTDEIQTTLHVSRFYVSGSYGRRVSLNGQIEVDLIVFLKATHGNPPYSGDLFQKLRKTLEQLCGTRNDSLFEMEKNQVSDSIFSFCGLSSSWTPTKCPYWPPHDDRTRNDIRPDHIKIKGKRSQVSFRVFLAPALGKSSETQRQVVYREMQRRFMEGKMPELDGWHPALLERPSEVIAEQSLYVQDFIRMCSAWAKTTGVSSLDPYAVEMLAFTAAQRTLYDEWKSRHLRCSIGGCQPRLLAFREYMMYILRPRAVDNNISPNSPSFDQNTHNSRAGAAEAACALVASLELDCVSAFKFFLETLKDLETKSPFWDISMPATFVSPWECFSVSCRRSSSGGGLTAKKMHTPVVTDFFNPYRNLLSTLTKSDLEILVKKAGTKLNHLERLMKVPLAMNEPQKERQVQQQHSEPGLAAQARVQKVAARGLRLFVWLFTFVLLLFAGLLAHPTTRLPVLEAYYSARASPLVQDLVEKTSSLFRNAVDAGQRTADSAKEWYHEIMNRNKDQDAPDFRPDEDPMFDEEDEYFSNVDL